MNTSKLKQGLNGCASNSRLRHYYNSTIRNLLVQKFAYKNVMQAPKLEKIVVTMGIKEASSKSDVIDKAVSELMAITGQKPVITKAKQSIAGFKLKEGDPLGCKVTLRDNMMYEFLDRLINIALPRMRDFKGFRPTQFDGHGNFAIGLKEQLVFPEINYDKVDKIRGMNIVMCTTAKTNIEAKALLEAFNVPYLS